MKLPRLDSISIYHTAFESKSERVSRSRGLACWPGVTVVGVVPPETEDEDPLLVPELRPKYFAIEFRSEGTPAAVAVAVFRPRLLNAPPVCACTFGCAARKAAFCCAAVCACCAAVCAAVVLEVVEDEEG
jgi:hypothetical protein